MMLISPILVFIAISNIIGVQYLLPVGKQKQYTISVVTGCIVNCLFNLLLIPRFLSIGAVIATIIAEFSVTAVQVYFVRNDFNFKNIILSNYKYIICSLIMFVPTYFVSNLLSPTIVNTILGVVLGGIIYIGLLFITKDKLLLETLNKIKLKF